ncbi:hypothetical protein CY34DRAFT_802968 [Suillus luteus UH-Slu-Lm8-n1]|uniref:Uncharacterized protein n=1 Tax=Suillus luteus UH-Slu-Lm8-n1 TaxID=930992 RepID=A0A0D0BLJ9_9AGAM|nr:hypothetical protein CY34DRAFT_802968 [Suillus luteus UH-Slu-Lm8-n1]
MAPIDAPRKVQEKKGISQPPSITHKAPGNALIYKVMVSGSETSCRRTVTMKGSFGKP